MGDKESGAAAYELEQLYPTARLPPAACYLSWTRAANSSTVNQFLLCGSANELMR